MDRKGRQRHPHQDSVNDFLKVSKKDKKDKIKTNSTLYFTPFDPEQAQQAVEVCAEFMKIANGYPNDPIKKVLDFAKKETKTKDPELVRWALMSFITHHPAARDEHLVIPSLIQRSPESCVPRRKVPLTPGPIIDETVKESEDNDIELLMNWFREDPNFNEHHEHWHVVYQGPGVSDPKNPEKTISKDRHGELFIYMHRQMLARYDAERLGMYLPLTQPLDDYRAPIKHRYEPNQQLVDSNDSYTTFGSRKVNSLLSDIESRKIKISNMEESLKKLQEAIEKGHFYDNTKITINLLGSIIEPSRVEQENWKELVDYYDSLHARGHIAIAYVNPSDPGVMYNPRVAARDPIFWCWHRHIDNLINKWEVKQGPNDFSSSPPVKIRDGDIILAFKDRLPINQGESQDSEAADFGEKTFGGKNFDKYVSNNNFVTHILETRMKTRLWKFVEDSGADEEIEYLYPREFYYFFRVENTSSSSLEATFRVFLVPEELADSRRHWIEMDKFKQSLPPRSKTVVCRDCDMSSVVRQPPQKTEDELDDTTTPLGTKDDQKKQFCDCGWPFHLLLPRGRKEGMKFKLLLFITDWSEDEVPRISRCGSISYCGAEGMAEKYPDKKPMGYPFDRPFKNDSYEETFAGLNNVTIRDVTISWVDNF